MQDAFPSAEEVFIPQLYGTAREFEYIQKKIVALRTHECHIQLVECSGTSRDKRGNAATYWGFLELPEWKLFKSLFKIGQLCYVCWKPTEPGEAPNGFDARVMPEAPGIYSNSDVVLLLQRRKNDLRSLEVSSDESNATEAPQLPVYIYFRCMRAQSTGFIASMQVLLESQSDPAYCNLLRFLQGRDFGDDWAPYPTNLKDENNIEAIGKEAYNKLTKGLDSSQVAAFKTILTSRVPFGIVQGVPGSGKTLLLIRGVQAYLKCKKRVLIASPGNAVADNIASRLHNESPDLRIIRYHTSALEEQALFHTAYNAQGNNKDNLTENEALKEMLRSKAYIARQPQPQ